MKKINLNFKGLFFVLVFFVSIMSVSAATTVTTIADLKALDNGTKVTFNGEAMTTLHLNYSLSTQNGIFIQDALGNAIFLQHAYLSETNTFFDDDRYDGYKMNKGGTEVFSFTGTFKKADSSYPDRIEFTDGEMENVKTGTTGNPIPYVEITKDELLADPSKYEGLALKLVADVTKEGTTFYTTTFCFMNSENKLPINIVSGISGGRSFPAAGTFYGMCLNYRNNYQYLISDRYSIEPTAFFKLNDLNEFVDDVNRDYISTIEIEIKEPVIVNYVAKMLNSANYYVESTNNAIPAVTSGVCISVLSRVMNISVQEGDSIKGLKGFYSKYKKDGEITQGSIFRIQEENLSKLEVVSSENNINWKEDKVYNILLNPSKYESRLLSLPIGTFKNVVFLENGQEVERTAFIQYDGALRKQYDTIRVQIAGGGDLTPYIDKEYAIMGILDLSETISFGYPTILLRDERDILFDREFENIGAMLAEGKPRSTNVEYSIKNPVLVTYKYYAENNVGGGEHMCGLYIQDSTGAILYKTGQQVAGVNVGDSVVGIKGKFQFGSRLREEAHYFKAEATTPLEVLSSANELKPLKVTLEEVVNDPMLYASRYIEIENLETIVRFGFSQGYAYETEMLYQNGITMTLNSLWKNKYDNMSVTGVVGYGIMGYGFTILPDQVRNTTKSFDGICYRIKDIKNLSAGTEFTYVGDATTTFTDYENGILIEDYTGGILLKNSKLGDNGTSAIKPGMLITNIKGKYHPSADDIIANIEILDEDLENIQVKEENHVIDYYSTDVNVINYFYSKYLEGKALMLRKPTILEKNGAYVFVFSYSDAEGNETVISLPVVTKGDIDITEDEFVGYVRKFDGVLTFVVVGNDASDTPVNIDDTKVEEGIFLSASKELYAPQAISIVVYDINGRVVTMTGASQINLSALNKGVYVVRATYVDGSYQIVKVIR